jgi:hypothetical protein
MEFILFFIIAMVVISSTRTLRSDEWDTADEWRKSKYRLNELSDYFVKLLDEKRKELNSDDIATFNAVQLLKVGTFVDLSENEEPSADIFEKWVLSEGKRLVSFMTTYTPHHPYYEKMATRVCVFSAIIGFVSHSPQQVRDMDFFYYVYRATLDKLGIKSIFGSIKNEGYQEN